MHDVERAWIGELVLGKLLDQDQVEPGAAAAPEEISGAQDDGAHAAIRRFTQAQLHLRETLAVLTQHAWQHRQHS